MVLRWSKRARLVGMVVFVPLRWLLVLGRLSGFEESGELGRLVGLEELEDSQRFGDRFLWWRGSSSRPYELSRSSAQYWGSLGLSIRCTLGLRATRLAHKIRALYNVPPIAYSWPHCSVCESPFPLGSASTLDEAVHRARLARESRMCPECCLSSARIAGYSLRHAMTARISLSRSRAKTKYSSVRSPISIRVSVSVYARNRRS